MHVGMRRSVARVVYVYHGDQILHWFVLMLMPRCLLDKCRIVYKQVRNIAAIRPFGTVDRTPHDGQLNATFVATRTDRLRLHLG